MKLIPGTEVLVKLDDKERRFVLVAADGGDGRRNIDAPLAVLLGAMAVGDTVKMWTPPVRGAEPMSVELIAVEVAQ